LKREREILEQVKHPFITELYFSFDTDTHNFMGMEFCNGGELYTLLNKGDREWSEEKVRYYAAEIVLALEYTHGKGILHRDIKSANFLFDKEGHIKLIDFGLSKNKIHNKLGRTETQPRGTINYIAPEMITEKEYGFSIDFYSLGLVIYEMLTAGEHPFIGPGFESVN